MQRIRRRGRPFLRRILLVTVLAAVLASILGAPAQASVSTGQPTGYCPGTFSHGRNGPSVDYWLINNTFLELSLFETHLDDGRWIETPPDFIPMGWTACWASERSFFLAGTEGIAHYSTQAGTVTLYWNNPIFGSSDFRCTPPPGYRCVRKPDAPGGVDDVSLPVFEIQFDF